MKDYILLFTVPSDDAGDGPFFHKFQATGHAAAFSIACKVVESKQANSVSGMILWELHEAKLLVSLTTDRVPVEAAPATDPAG